jgi:hypothetical protein
MAPEIIYSVMESDASPTARDIYAFACSIIEVRTTQTPLLRLPEFPCKIYSGKVPFHDYKSEVDIMGRVLAGERPLRPLALDSDVLWSLVESCWIHSPRQRATITSVCNRLGELMSLPVTPWTSSSMISLQILHSIGDSGNRFTQVLYRLLSFSQAPNVRSLLLNRCKTTRPITFGYVIGTNHRLIYQALRSRCRATMECGKERLSCC